MNVVLAVSVLVVAAVVTNVLCWWGIARDQRTARPWHWTVLVGSFAYYPWLSRVERRRLPERDLDSLPHESFIPPEMVAKLGRKVTR